MGICFLQLEQLMLHVNVFHYSYKKEGKKQSITIQKLKQIRWKKRINFADNKIKHIPFALVGKMKMVRMRARVQQNNNLYSIFLKHMNS